MVGGGYQCVLLPLLPGNSSPVDLSGVHLPVRGEVLLPV